MRALLLVAALLACTPEDDSDDAESSPQPTCEEVLGSTRYCQEHSLGSVGLKCNPDGPDDGTWPTGCVQVNYNPSTNRAEVCCP